MLWRNRFSCQPPRYAMKWTLCLVAVVMATATLAPSHVAGASETCEDGEWACLGGIWCVDQRDRCNGMPDCFDNSDETVDCEGNCADDTFQCAYNNVTVCNLNEFKCDQYSDCDDHSDEAGCPPPVCEEDWFMCRAKKGGFYKCFHNREKCDQITNCLDDSDEVGCKTWTTWSPWGPCSTTCLLGYTIRRRTCIGDRGSCEGKAQEQKGCNALVPCPYCLDESEDKFLASEDGQLLTCEEFLGKFGYSLCEPGHEKQLNMDTRCCETCDYREWKYSHLPDCKWGDKNDAWCEKKYDNWPRWLCEDNKTTANRCCGTCSTHKDAVTSLSMHDDLQ